MAKPLPPVLVAEPLKKQLFCGFTTEIAQEEMKIGVQNNSKIIWNRKFYWKILFQFYFRRGASVHLFSCLPEQSLDIVGTYQGLEPWRDCEVDRLLLAAGQPVLLRQTSQVAVQNVPEVLYKFHIHYIKIDKTCWNSYCIFITRALINTFFLSLCTYIWV